MSISRRTLLASLGLTLPAVAAEAATRRPKKPVAVKHNVSHQPAHTTRSSRTRRPAPPTQS